MKHYTRKRFDATQSIGFLLNRARNVAWSELDQALKPLEITGQQMSVLLAVSRGVASTPFELSKLLGIDTGLMTRMLDRLEEKELLLRRRSLEDRRVVNLELTPQGEQVASRASDIAPDVLNHRLRDFSQTEFEELVRLLRKFGD